MALSISEPEDLITKQSIRPEMLRRAREMRRDMTPAEAVLWNRLKANRLEGYHFRRQQIIEPFIVDFYCHATGLVVEVDGDVHLQQQDYDRQRDEVLRSMGLAVLHFTNVDVFQNLGYVLGEIFRVCEQRKLELHKT